MIRNIIKFSLNLKCHNTVKKPFCTIINQDITNSEVATVSSNTPIIRDHVLKDLRVTSEDPREIWVESLSSIKEEKVGLVSLHPDIFAFVPRLDIIYENVQWQYKYKYVERTHEKLPVEMRGPGRGLGRKPWPQKGTGRARQGSTRAVHWVKGGTLYGKRRFTTTFHMIPFNLRVLGLISTFSIKFAQDDLKVVDSLDMPSDEPGYLEQLVEERNWGPSVLFADVDDIVPENIALATDSILHLNILPVYGLNVHSMLKHETLVLTVAAVERIQEKLIGTLNSLDYSRRGGRKIKT